MKQLRIFMAALALFIGLGAAVPAMAVAAETPKQSVCNALGAGGNCQSNPSGVGVDKIITTVINVLSFVVGVVAVIMIIVGGFKYITAGGDSNNVSSAKNTIIYAVIGLVVVALAQVIVYFVLNSVTS